jgi:hypothetical protein
LLGGKDNAQVIEWFADAMCWDETDWTTEDFGLHARYLGPCLTPAEVEARIATARKDALAEAARRARHYATVVQMHGSLKSDIYEAAGQAATEIAASIEALVEKGVADLAAQAKREALEEAARRLEELHKNHNYDPESGALTKKLGRYDRWPESAKAAKLEHDTGYYRAIAEGVAHIRALKGEAND